MLSGLLNREAARQATSAASRFSSRHSLQELNLLCNLLRFLHRHEYALHFLPGQGNPSVVAGVALQQAQRSEEIAEIPDAADREPDRRRQTDQEGHDDGED